MARAKKTEAEKQATIIDYPLCFSKIRNAKKFIVQANNLYKQGEEKIMDRTLQNLINRSLELEKEINNLNPGHRTKAVDRKYRPIIKTGLYICILWTGIFGLVVGGYIY